MNRKNYDYIVVGGNICSLITAKELAAQGKSIAFAAPPRSIGGHFAEYSVFDFPFDMGMVLLEFDSYMEQLQDASLYDESTLGSVGKFSDVVERYVSQYVDHHSVQDLVVAVRGRLIKDYYISNHLDGVAGVFTSDELSDIQRQLKHSVETTRFHPREKAKSSRYDGLDYQTCSEENHGELLHRVLIEPLVEKVSNTHSSNLDARQHRLFWAPLFYPETLLSAINGDGVGIPPTTFSYPIKASVGSVSKKIYDEVCRDSGVDVYDSIEALAHEGTGWLLNDTIYAEKLVSSLPQDAMSNLMALPSEDLEKTSYALIFMRVEGACDFDVLFNADPNYCFYRLINNTRLRGESLEDSYLVVEYNLDYTEHQEESFFEKEKYIDEIILFLKEYGISDNVRVLDQSPVYLRNKLAFPTIENINRSLKNAEGFGRLENISLMGAALGMGLSSFNNQIVQAIKYVSQEEGV